MIYQLKTTGNKLTLMYFLVRPYYHIYSSLTGYYINYILFHHLTLVTGVSLHAYRERNNPHGKIFIRSVYYTRCPKQPYLPIYHYKQRPQGLPRQIHVTCNPARTQPNLYQVYVYFYTTGISADVTIAARTPPLCQEPDN